ncbi:MAG: hypothetical protein II630_02610, partial [Bacteroidales bacterium]|nr:hypothetical protein [Bacteroidales bacterium]
LRPDRALGVHHGILVTQLVGDVRLEIFNGSGEGRNDGVPLLRRRRPCGKHQDKKDSASLIDSVGGWNQMGY